MPIVLKSEWLGCIREHSNIPRTLFPNEHENDPL